MARNTGKNYRKGSQTGREQIPFLFGSWAKIDTTTDQIIAIKREGRFKGVSCRNPSGN